MSLSLMPQRLENGKFMGESNGFSVKLVNGAPVTVVLGCVLGLQVEKMQIILQNIVSLQGKPHDGPWILQ